MTGKPNKPFAPDYAVPPSQTLAESLAAAGMSQAELARLTGLSRRAVSGIIHGKASITPEMALRLETVFRVPAHFWTKRWRSD